MVAVCKDRLAGTLAPPEDFAAAFLATRNNELQFAGTGIPTS
jgi:hypothetical protein